ncbi:HTH domain-containing protein [Pedobacter gandavensis]|uniref:HTH domain-containing protein n=1 Tax=Pedobacter gandavensis TaxID=2679963 RepID=UPI00397782DD
MPKHYFDKLEYLDRLIYCKSTGAPDYLAKKLNISKRTVFDYINILKSLGAEVKYCRQKKTYYYYYSGRFNFRFVQNKT